MARSDAPVPVAYPSSCSPQAWSSASVLLLVRSMLGLEPDASGALRASAPSPTRAPDLRISGISCGGDDHTVEVRAGSISVITE